MLTYGAHAIDNSWYSGRCTFFNVSWKWHCHGGAMKAHGIAMKVHDTRNAMSIPYP